MKTIRTAASNFLIFIEDVKGGRSALSDRPSAIMSTPSCISVGTLNWQDDDPTISFGHMSDVTETGSPAFDGLLETPSGEIVVSVVDRTILLDDRIGSPLTRVRVWTNHPSEPDEIVISFERHEPRSGVTCAARGARIRSPGGRAAAARSR